MCLGIPGRIVELRDDTGFPMGMVDFGGVRREVCLAYVQADVGVGDYVIVHELLHFHAPNHGKLWKSLMRAHLGDYELQDLRLRRRVRRKGLAISG